MPHFSLAVIMTTLKMFIILGLVFSFAGLGTLVGIATGFMESTPVLDITRIEEQAESSFIYDRHGNLITTYHGLENRIWASIDEIPPILQNAFISIEDARFRSHNGIDLKRIAGSFVNNFLNESLQGGSTITQQLIKNTLLTPERSYRRKLQEAYLAIQLEQQYTKDQILEAYLNTIYLGNGNHGVKTAAYDYFRKPLNELSIREAALLAGIPRSTTRFNPRRNFYDPERISILFNRTNTVLFTMLENGFITRAEFEAARFGEDELAGMFADNFTIVQERANQQVLEMPHFVEHVILDVADHLMQQNGWTGQEGRQRAMALIHEGGLHIYTTVDTEVQLKAEEAIYSYDDFPSMASENDQVLRDDRGNEVAQPQASMVIIDNQTGEIRALVGGRTPPLGRFWLNRANQSWPVGSAIKPLSLYAPFIEENFPGGIILENTPGPIEGWDIGDQEWGYPRNFPGARYTGPVPASTALALSFNTTAARAVFRLTAETSAEALKQLGITSPHYVDEKNPSDLALGSNGINIIEFTAAYAAIANKGVYQKPISFTRVLDRNRNEILNNQNFQISRRVFSESTAFIVTEWLKQAASPRGTGSRAMFGEMPVAGKTGTNQGRRGVMFSGFTPYYTATVWIGHDRLQSLSNDATAGSFAAPLWRVVMEPIHANLESVPFFSQVPEGVVQVQVCGISGNLPNGTLCNDHLITEWFPRDAVPREICTMHTLQIVCRFSGKLLSPFCPPDHALERSKIIIPHTSPLALLSDEDLERSIPGAVRAPVPDETGALAEGAIDFTALDYANPLHRVFFCPLHTEEWASAETNRALFTERATILINDVSSNLNNPEFIPRISFEERTSLNEAMASLRTILDQVSVEPPPETGPFLTELILFDSVLAETQFNALSTLNIQIFENIRAQIEFEENQRQLPIQEESQPEETLNPNE